LDKRSLPTTTVIDYARL